MTLNISLNKTTPTTDQIQALNHKKSMQNEMLLKNVDTLQLPATSDRVDSDGRGLK